MATPPGLPAVSRLDRERPFPCPPFPARPSGQVRGPGGSPPVQAHPRSLAPGQMLLSRGPWRSQLPGKMEDSVQRCLQGQFPPMYVSPIKSFKSPRPPPPLTSPVARAFRACFSPLAGENFSPQWGLCFRPSRKRPARGWVAHPSPSKMLAKLKEKQHLLRGGGRPQLSPQRTGGRAAPAVAPHAAGKGFPGSQRSLQPALGPRTASWGQRAVRGSSAQQSPGYPGRACPVGAYL